VQHVAVERSRESRRFARVPKLKAEANLLGREERQAPREVALDVGTYYYPKRLNDVAERYRTALRATEKRRKIPWASG
jgi:hypothetical protein